MTLANQDEKEIAMYAATDVATLRAALKACGCRHDWLQYIWYPERYVDQFLRDFYHHLQKAYCDSPNRLTKKRVEGLGIFVILLMGQPDPTATRWEEMQLQLQERAYFNRVCRQD